MHSNLISDLAIVTLVAGATGLLMRRLGQPTILGYLLAGLIVGPYIPIPMFADPARMAELAEVGVVLVMFAVGLEFRVRRLLEILPTSGLTAGIQIATLMWAGFTIGSFLGWTTTASVCLGASIAISSTMVVSSVFRTRPVDADVRAHVFGVLVVQDVVAIVLIAVVTALAAGETLGVKPLAMMLGQLAGMVTAMMVVALFILPRLVRYVLNTFDAEVLIVVVAASAFGLAMVAEGFGYSAALGAFICGMAVAESGRAHDVDKAIEPLRSLFSAIFFVSTGMSVDPLVAARHWPLAAALCVVVIGTQLASVAVSTVLSGASLRRGVFAGLALGQIGEFSFILATIAVAKGAVPEETLPALVTVATVTAFTTPLLLGRGDRLVNILDRWIPHPLHRAMAAYHAFLRRSEADKTRPSLKGPVLAVVLDWGAILVTLVVRHNVKARLHLDDDLWLNVAAALIIAPFIIGLVRSATKAAAVVRTLARANTGSPALGKLVEAIALVAVVLGAGLPTLAMLRPLVVGPWGEVAFVGAFLTVLIVLGLRLRTVDRADAAGVVHMAMGLADRVVPVDEAAAVSVPLSFNSGPLAGFDYTPIAVDAGGPAEGRTLAELDLRCRTGATVIAICRGEVTTPLPTGREKLSGGDVLAVSGSVEALERVRAILSLAPQAAA